MNFGEGELKTDDLLTRLELIREEMEEKEKIDPTIETTGELGDNVSEVGPLLANDSLASVDSALNPWRRTVSHLSLAIAEESEYSKVHVEVSVIGKVGPFYDRHTAFAIALPERVTRLLICNYCSVTDLLFSVEF